MLKSSPLPFRRLRTSCPVGEKLCILIGPLRLLRASAGGEIAPHFPRGFSHQLTYNCVGLYSVQCPPNPEGGTRKPVSISSSVRRSIAWGVMRKHGEWARVCVFCGMNCVPSQIC